MSSSVHFKFKSQKEPSRVTFDGTGISVFELKREIINQSRLGDGTDFELSIHNEDTREGKFDANWLPIGSFSLAPLRSGYFSDKFQNTMTTQPLFHALLLLSLGGFLRRGLEREVLHVMSPGKCQSTHVTLPVTTNRLQFEQSPIAIQSATVS